MSEFDTILHNSLQGVTVGFEQAVEDLNSLVGELSQAVQKALQPIRTKLRLEPLHENADEAVFRLELLVMKQKNGPPPLRGDAVGDYHVTHKGYPVSAGSWDRRLVHRAFPPVVVAGWDSSGGFTVAEILNNKVDLENHFKKMLANPSSALVTQIAFHRRQQKSSA